MSAQRARGGAPPRGGPRNTQQRSRKIWSGLAFAVFLLPAAAVLLPTTLVLGVTMMPTLAAFIVDRLPGKALTVTVGMLNFTGSLPAVLALWQEGHRLSSVSIVLGEPMFWMGAYMAAAVGWMIFLTLPTLLRRYYTSTTDARVHALERRQEELREEWGPAVTGDPGESPEEQKAGEEPFS